MANRQWGICGSCDKHRPIHHKQGESPYHQWVCIDCAQPTDAEIAALKEEVRRAKIEAYQEALEVLRVHDKPAAQAIISDKLKQEVQ